MKYESPDICLPVSLSGSLYYRLIEVLRVCSQLSVGCGQLRTHPMESQAHPDPNTAIVTAVRRFVAEATPNRKTPRRSAANAAVNTAMNTAWSDDWIMFGAPPASSQTPRPLSARRFTPTVAPAPSSTPARTENARPRSGDWCVGCSGADTDLLEG
ncbi:hypothetical protein [Propionivibrio dicarboxylicus]|uniref:Uncharacterized protein n=1 Tax=Propionivibrio dicarboxylicus TaxID=83767 RepID=A0A1G8ABP2_9RHOO|nr:hypothetical protein [Propionivibrio dicarboxylicus]SDH18256.1 hypothetical protein SAMN05660652_01337 [Propionivibrio dicarboxylicus]